jgi:hypothetical protein
MYLVLGYWRVRYVITGNSDFLLSMSFRGESDDLHAWSAGAGGGRNRA